MAADSILIIITILLLWIVIALPFLVNTFVLCRLRNNLIRACGAVEENYLEELKKVTDNDNLKDETLIRIFSDFQKLKLEVSRELAKEFPQRKGLTRFTVMSSVIFIIGIVLIYFIISGESEELLKSTLTILTGAFTTIIGFYFGGRAEEIKNEDVDKIAKGVYGEKTPQK